MVKIPNIVFLDNMFSVFHSGSREHAILSAVSRSVSVYTV